LADRCRARGRGAGSSRAELAKAEAEARRLESAFEFSLGFDRPTRPARSADGRDHDDPRDLVGALGLAATTGRRSRAAAARYQATLERVKLAAERPQFLLTVSGGPRNLNGELPGVASIDVVPPVFDAGIGGRAVAAGRPASSRRPTSARSRSAPPPTCRAAERLSAAESFPSHHARPGGSAGAAPRASPSGSSRPARRSTASLVLARRDEE
jgi:hypothetical protein